jgi:hypothetical protein
LAEELAFGGQTEEYQYPLFAQHNIQLEKPAIDL